MNLNKNKFYLGSISNQQLAGLLADMITVQSKAIQSIANFSLSKCDILSILFERSIIPEGKFLNDPQESPCDSSDQ